MWLKNNIKKNFFLLNRLDFLTSGIVLGCYLKEFVDLYKRYQEQGKIKKYYIAIVNGIVEKEIVIQSRIDDCKRKKVKILNQRDDFLRFSWVKPLTFLEEENKTFILIKILKGRRHQIRAHLSHIGHPIVGDHVYGLGGEEFLCLHHAVLVTPNFMITSFPNWDFFKKRKNFIKKIKDTIKTWI